MNKCALILVIVLSMALQAHPSGAQTGNQAPAEANKGKDHPKESKIRMRDGILMLVLDRDKDGALSIIEIRRAPDSLRLLDQNGDGMVDKDELTFLRFKGIGQGYENREFPTGVRPMPE